MDQWYYLVGSETRGPVPSSQILEMIRGGQLNSSIQVAQSGWQTWSPASVVWAHLLSSPAPAVVLGGQPSATAIPVATPAAPTLGSEVRARSRDAWEGMKLFARSPVGGLPQSYAMFDPPRAMRVGLAFAAIYEAAFLLSLYITGSNVAGFFSIPIQISDASVSGLLKLILIGLVPFVSLAGAAAIARTVFGGTGQFAGDVYTAGASLLPFGLTVLASALLGSSASFEIISFLFVFAMSYNVLMLYAGCSRIAGVPEASAAPAVPVMLIVSAWLTRVMIGAIV